MLFNYKAFDRNNNIIEGELEVKDEAAVLDHLNLNSLKPISVQPALTGQAKKFNLNFLSSQIKHVDKIFLIRYLVLLLKSGSDLLQSINLLLLGIDKPSIKAILKKIQRNLEKGQPFYLAFEEYQRQFSKVFVSLIKAGERSGTLVNVLEDVEKHLTEEY